jgi:nitroreductase
MEFKDVLTGLQSIREYADQPVPEEKLNIILEAARISQSGGNRQQWKFIVVRDQEKRKQLTEAANNQPHVGQAPVIIAAVALNPERIMLCEVPSYAIDMGIAVENMALAAFDQGLGSCWIGAFSQEKARQALGVPDKYKVAALLPLGYPKTKKEKSSRKTMAETICYDTFKE